MPAAPHRVLRPSAGQAQGSPPATPVAATTGAHGSWRALARPHSHACTREDTNVAPPSRPDRRPCHRRSGTRAGTAARGSRAHRLPSATLLLRLRGLLGEQRLCPLRLLLRDEVLFRDRE